MGLNDINSLRTLQKNVLNGIEELVRKKQKKNYVRVIDIVKKYGFTPTKTHHGYLINIKELSEGCLLEIKQCIEKTVVDTI